jgi:hypothetical protein
VSRPVCSAARADCAAFGSTRGARRGAIEADVGQDHSLRGGEHRGAPDRNGRATRVAERVRGRHWLTRVKSAACGDRSGYAHAPHMANHVERTSTATLVQHAAAVCGTQHQPCAACKLHATRPTTCIESAARSSAFAKVLTPPTPCARCCARRLGIDESHARLPV